jgi:membrane protein YqaA with SNARE-associated domain
MTTTRLAFIGAAVLNVPTIFAATLLPAGAIAISAAVLAATGAGLGAMLGWGISKRTDQPAATARFEPAGVERIAA